MSQSKKPITNTSTKTSLTADQRRELNAFKKKVYGFFKVQTVQDAIDRRIAGVHTRHYTVPALASYLGMLPAELIAIDDFRKKVVDYSLLQCENYILNALFDARIDRNIGILLLEQYHGYGRRKAKQDGSEKRKTISDILDEIETNR